MKYRAFVISLERASTRRAHAEALLAELPLPAEILAAVDGRAMTPKEIGAVHQQDLYRPHYPFELDAGNVGCFLSHRAVWNQIVERELDAALVLEDDVRIDRDVLNKAIDFASKNCPPGAYIQLPVRPLPANARQIVGGDDCRIVCPQVTPLRTSGQWVTRGAAEKLLAVTQTIDRPVDTTLQMHWITGVRLLAIEPSGISDMTADLGGSTIGAGKDRHLTLQKLSREVTRVWYRWQVARRSAA